MKENHLRSMGGWKLLCLLVLLSSVCSSQNMELKLNYELTDGFINIEAATVEAAVGGSLKAVIMNVSIDVSSCTLIGIQSPFGAMLLEPDDYLQSPKEFFTKKLNANELTAAEESIEIEITGIFELFPHCGNPAIAVAVICGEQIEQDFIAYNVACEEDVDLNFIMPKKMPQITNVIGEKLETDYVLQLTNTGKTPLAERLYLDGVHFKASLVPDSEIMQLYMIDLTMSPQDISKDIVQYWMNDAITMTSRFSGTVMSVGGLEMVLIDKTNEKGKSLLVNGVMDISLNSLTSYKSTLSPSYNGLAALVISVDSDQQVKDSNRGNNYAAFLVNVTSPLTFDSMKDASLSMGNCEVVPLATDLSQSSIIYGMHNPGAFYNGKSEVFSPVSNKVFLDASMDYDLAATTVTRLHEINKCTAENIDKSEGKKVVGIQVLQDVVNTVKAEFDGYVPPDVGKEDHDKVLIAMSVVQGIMDTVLVKDDSDTSKQFWTQIILFHMKKKLRMIKSFQEIKNVLNKEYGDTIGGGSNKCGNGEQYYHTKHAMEDGNDMPYKPNSHHSPKPATTLASLTPQSDSVQLNKNSNDDGSVTCDGGTKIVEKAHVCDGFEDCKDDEDEKNCRPEKKIPMRREEATIFIGKGKTKEQNKVHPLEDTPEVNPELWSFNEASELAEELTTGQKSALKTSALRRRGTPRPPRPHRPRDIINRFLDKHNVTNIDDLYEILKNKTRKHHFHNGTKTEGKRNSFKKRFKKMFRNRFAYLEDENVNELIESLEDDLNESTESTESLESIEISVEVSDIPDSQTAKNKGSKKGPAKSKAKNKEEKVQKLIEALNDVDGDILDSESTEDSFEDSNSIESDELLDDTDIITEEDIIEIMSEVFTGNKEKLDERIKRSGKGKGNGKEKRDKQGDEPMKTVPLKSEKMSMPVGGNIKSNHNNKSHADYYDDDYEDNYDDDYDDDYDDCYKFRDEDHQLIIDELMHKYGPMKNNGHSCMDNEAQKMKDVFRKLFMSMMTDGPEYMPGFDFIPISLRKSLKKFATEVVAKPPPRIIESWVKAFNVSNEMKAIPKMLMETYKEEVMKDIANKKFPLTKERLDDLLDYFITNVSLIAKKALEEETGDQKELIALLDMSVEYMKFLKKHSKKIINLATGIFMMSMFPKMALDDIEGTPGQYPDVWEHCLASFSQRRIAVMKKKTNMKEEKKPTTFASVFDIVDEADTDNKKLREGFRTAYWKVDNNDVMRGQYSRLTGLFMWKKVAVCGCHNAPPPFHPMDDPYMMAGEMGFNMPKDKFSGDWNGSGMWNGSGIGGGGIGTRSGMGGGIHPNIISPEQYNDLIKISVAISKSNPSIDSSEIISKTLQSLQTNREVHTLETEDTLRLLNKKEKVMTDGTMLMTGVVSVSVKGISSSICDDHWGAEEARVICRGIAERDLRIAQNGLQLGNSLSQYSTTLDDATSGGNNVIPKTHISDVQCDAENTNISNILHCHHIWTDDAKKCLSKEPAAVTCSFKH